MSTRDRQQLKIIIISTNRDKKSLETEFLMAICRPTGDKWQSKTLFLASFDTRSSFVKSIYDCRLSGVTRLEVLFLVWNFNYISINKNSKGSGNRCAISAPDPWLLAYVLSTKILCNGSLRQMSFSVY